MKALAQLEARASAALRTLLRRDVPLAQHTTYRVGGPAALWLEPTSEALLREAVGLCAALEVPLALLGKGSNVIAPDGGIDGLVIKLGQGLGAIERLDPDHVRAQAGASLEALSTAVQGWGRCGFEFMFDVPATVGGAVLMNAGNNLGEVRQVLRRVRCLAPGGEVLSLEAGQLELSYRHSRFQHSGEIVLEAVFALGEADDPAAIGERMRESRAIRAAKFPMEHPNAGSVFRRPPGHYAGQLIQACGLKGLRVGDAMVSPKHAGFIVNLGAARAADILALVEKVQAAVMQQCGVQMELEQVRLEARVPTRR